MTSLSYLFTPNQIISDMCLQVLIWAIKLVLSRKINEPPCTRTGWVFQSPGLFNYLLLSKGGGEEVKGRIMEEEERTLLYETYWAVQTLWSEPQLLWRKATRYFCTRQYCRDCASIAYAVTHGIKGFVIPTKSFVKIGIAKYFATTRKCLNLSTKRMVDAAKFLVAGTKKVLLSLILLPLQNHLFSVTQNQRAHSQYSPGMRGLLTSWGMERRSRDKRY